MAALLPRLKSNAERAGRARAVLVLMAGALLLLLAGASYGLSFLALGAFALPLALAIASAKALIVLWVFMEFGELSSSARLAAGAALLMFALLVSLMVADVATRECPPVRLPGVSSASQRGCP